MKTSNCPHDEELKVDGEVKAVVGDTSVSSGGAGLADGAPSTNGARCGATSSTKPS